MFDISVIICTKNRINKLQKALDSLRTQYFKNFEVIIVNDGGYTVSGLVKEYKDLNIKLIEREISKGAASSRNLAMDNASGVYYAFLDDDDYYLPDHLNNAIEFFNQKQTNFYYCSTYISKIRDYDINKIKNESIIHSYEYNQELFQMLCFIPMSSVIIKSTNLRFDDNLKVCEDWEFWLRLSLNGYTPKLDERISVVYFRVPSEFSFSNNALVEVDNYMFFYNCWKKIIKRNYLLYNNSFKIEKIVAFHEHCITKLKEGNRLPHFYFENFTKLFIENSDMELQSFIKKIEILLED